MSSETIKSLFTRCGIVTPKYLAELDRTGSFTVNSSSANSETSLQVGDSVSLDNQEFSIGQVPERSRLRVRVVPAFQGNIPDIKRIHCGYHKCLTMYVRKVMGRVARKSFTSQKFRHFYHRADVFYQAIQNFDFASISGHRLDLDRFDHVLVSRFIRDPRDLLVSGYFYHKRSAEEWCDIVDPVDEDWEIVQGCVPSGVRKDESFAAYLNRVSLADGLLAEIEFRARHYSSMAAWPRDDPRVRLYRYEDIMGNEASVFADLMKFYQLPMTSRVVGRYYASRYSASRKSGKKGHIRNASSGQWKQYFTPEVNARFNEVYGDLLKLYDYDLVENL